MFGTGLNGIINPPDPNRTFTLEQVELAVPHEKAWELLYDFQIILDIAKELPDDSMKASQALYTANKIVNAFQPHEDSSIEEALTISKEFLRHKNGSSDQFKLTAVGNCHIDTAWLW